jgi:hypothetical protein
LGIILGTGLLAGGFVDLRNAQVGAGQGLKEREDRITELESEIELYETRMARLTSRPELLTTLQARKPDLRRLGIGEVIRLEHEAAAAPAGGGGKP